MTLEVMKQVYVRETDDEINKKTIKESREQVFDFITEVREQENRCGRQTITKS